MANPFFSNRVLPNGATQQGEPVNEAHKKYSRGYSTFDLSVPHFISARYAELTPHEVFECVEGDRIEISNSHNIRSDAFVGPFMNEVSMRKSYFAVDYRAFLPNSWKYIYPLSIDGDDIPNVEVNTVVDNFHSVLRSFLKNYQRLYAYVLDNYDAIRDRDIYFPGLVFKYLFFFECFFSGGSLLRYLRSNFYTRFRVGDNINVDNLFDQLSSVIAGSGGIYLFLTYGEGSTTYRYAFSTSVPVPSDYVRVDLRTMFDLIREHPDCSLDVAKSVLAYFNNLLLQLDISDSEYSDNIPFNFSRVCAYQLVCAQFFTNDKIDYVQSAHEYIDNMQYVLSTFKEELKEIYDYSIFYQDFESYEMNGISVRYDVLSGHSISTMFKWINGVLNDWLVEDLVPSGLPLVFGLQPLLNFVMNLFTYRKNLRFGDYFTGARSRPLAVGDVETPVVGNAVSTLDSTRNLLIQRFRNAVNRVGDRLSDYIEGVMGGKAAPDVTLPRYLATITSSFKGYEVENTADEQGKIVTVLNSTDGKYVYEIEAGEPCIVIGITSFMSQRIYSDASDRFFFHKDRYDMFNPFYQYAGDQEIYSAERNGRLGLGPFAYTLRHMEYKQRVPMASGAFIANLPGYAFVTDNAEGDRINRENLDSERGIHISPDYIRSQNHEFDRFFPSLTGYSLASYYHFYLKYNNNLIAHRRMEYSPSML